MRVRIPEEAELAPFHRAALASLTALGVPRVHDLNDLDADTGVAPSPVNIAGGVRWNAALAYLDPVRERASLRIAGDAPAERLVVRGGRVRGAVVRGAGEPVVEAERVIVCAGAYDSPALLLRSGIGPADDLRALGIPVVADLPGVGANLHDHPAIELGYSGTPELRALCAEHAASGAFAPIEGVIAKLRSSLCSPEGFDLHVYPVGGVVREGFEFWIPVACLTPRSRGHVRLAGPAGTLAPVIDHAYCSDAGGHDHGVLRDGVEIARSLARQRPVRRAAGRRESLRQQGSLPPKRWTRSSRTTTTRPAPAPWGRSSTSACACMAWTGSSSRTARSSRPCRAPTRACRPCWSRTGSRTGSRRRGARRSARRRPGSAPAPRGGAMWLESSNNSQVEPATRRWISSTMRGVASSCRPEMSSVGALDLREALGDVPVLQRARDVELARPDHRAVHGRVREHECERPGQRLGPGSRRQT